MRLVITKVLSEKLNMLTSWKERKSQRVRERDDRGEKEREKVKPC